MLPRLHPRIRFTSVALCAAAAMALSACGEDAVEEKAEVIRPVRTVVVAAVPTAMRRIYPAIVLPAQQVELSFRVPGRIIELPIRAAMAISEGEVIAQLDQRDFESAVARLESQLGRATSQLEAMTSGARSEDLASLRANVRAAEAQVEVQAKQVARIGTLAERGSMARADLDREQARLVVDEANLNAARQELAKGEIGARSEDVEAQNAAIRDLETQIEQARDNLADTTLRAPFDGIVASRRVENYANVNANSVVAVLQKLETVDLQFDVPASDVVQLAQHNNTVIKARLDSAPDKEFEAELVEFETQADAATQTFMGRVSIDNPQEVTVLPGMTGSIVITVAQDDRRVLAVPASALAAEPDGSAYVWVVDPQSRSVSKRRVTAKNLAGSDVAITDGLVEGEIVVTAGVSYLRGQMTVKPIMAAE